MARTTTLLLLVLLLLFGCNQGEDTPQQPIAPAATAPAAPGATPAAAPVAAGQPVPAPQQPAAENAFQIGGSVDMRTAAIRVRRLFRADHRNVRVATSPEGQWTLVTGPGADQTAANNMASELQTEVRAVESPPATILTPVLMTTTRSLNLRGSPDGNATLLRTLPKGTILVALHGTVEGQTSQAAGQGTWSWVMASVADHGWSAGRYLEPYTSCIPLPAHLVRDAPGGRGAHVRRDVTFSRVDLRHQGRAHQGVMMLVRDPDRRSSYVSITRDRGQCNLERIHFVTVPGFVENAFLANSTRQGGDSLLITASHPNATMDPQGAETWRVYDMTREHPVYQTEKHTSLGLVGRQRVSIRNSVARSASNQAGWWPLTFREPGPEGARTYLRWDGRTLVEDPEAAIQ